MFICICFHRHVDYLYIRPIEFFSFKFCFYIPSEHVEWWQDLESTQSGEKEGEVEICDAEILDEFTTSRGELKLISLIFTEDQCI